MSDLDHQSAAALQESERRYRILVPAASDVVYRMSADWTELKQLVGRAFLLNTERPDRDWLTRYIHPDDRASHMRAVREALRTVSVFELEHRVVRADGTLGWVYSRAVPLLDDDGQIIEWVGTARDVTDRRRDENRALVQRQILELTATGASLQTVLDQLMRMIESQEPGMIAGVLLTDDGVHFRPSSGPSLPPAFREALHEAIKTIPVTPPYFASCAEAVHCDTIIHVSDVSRETRYDTRWCEAMTAAGFASVRSTPIYNSDGCITGCLALYFSEARRPDPMDPELVDMTTHLAAIAIERDRAQAALHRRAAQLKLLLDELNHRVKNTMATVQSIAAQTLRNAATVKEGRQALESRLIALSRAHDVLNQRHWGAAQLKEVVTRAIEPYCRQAGTARFDVQGPEIWLQPKAALILSMGLHELATNAIKYGALSQPSGRIGIHWAIKEDRRSVFQFIWREMDGPAVYPPARRGFGSRLIERGLIHDLSGDVDLAFEPQGVVCTIEAPLEALSVPNPDVGPSFPWSQ